MAGVWVDASVNPVMPEAARRLVLGTSSRDALVSLHGTDQVTSILASG